MPSPAAIQQYLGAGGSAAGVTAAGLSTAGIGATAGTGATTVLALGLVSTGIGAALAVVPLALAAFGIGKPNWKKLDDTLIIVEAQIALNKIWLQLSGEALIGARGEVQAGDCFPEKFGGGGRDCHVQLFGTRTKYPNVPGGRTGFENVDPRQAVAAAQALIREAQTNLKRSVSLKNPFFTEQLTNAARPSIALFALVARRRQQREQPGLGESSFTALIVGGLVLAAQASGFLPIPKIGIK